MLCFGLKKQQSVIHGFKRNPDLLLEEEQITCPYCGECLNILIDPSDAGQEYIEDCQVCCRPIIMQVNDNGTSVDARSDSD